MDNLIESDGYGHEALVTKDNCMFSGNSCVVARCWSCGMLNDQDPDGAPITLQEVLIGAVPCQGCNSALVIGADEKPTLYLAISIPNLPDSVRH